MDDAALQDAAAVRVAVRVRPLITRELLQGSKTCISTDGPCVTVGRDRRFTFDHAFGPSTQQEQIYLEVVSPLVESCFDGFNVTVLAYGQTGSGKTFTMGTGECGGSGISGCAGGGAGAEEAQQQLLQHMGIAPRVIRHVFEGIAARRHQASFQVRAQFLEIYNEDVKDLLVPPAEQTTKWISRDPAPGSGGGSITLRDAGDGTILVVGAVEEAAQCAEDLAELLERGMALRATSSTCANEQSSRSHAILTIIIEQHLQPSPAGGSPEGGASVASSVGGAATGVGPGQLAVDGHGSGAGAGGAPVEIRTAKLHLVDLAGSERTKQLRTSMQGPRFRETVNINQGLLALGNVISALGDERRRGSHVPYRESKLTRLLQDSLGGNSRTAMIACISPADDVLEETLNTLKYANRAKNIRNKPVVNRALPGDAQSPLRGAVQQMQLQVLQQLAAQLPDGSLARGLPLAELLALDAADSAACLDVLGRMKSALAASGPTSRATSMDGGALGRQLLGLLHSNRNGDISGGGAGGAAAEVETLVSGCSRAIAGILHGLAEMEAQGQINREAREHILRSLDASTLRLLPVVRSIGPRSSAVAPLPPSPLGSRSGASPPGEEEGGAARGPESELGSEPSAEASPPGAGASSERERELEERVRCLESELSSCRAELREAQDDLERDEIIFADKMKELQDAQASSADLKQRLQDSEERHSREVEELRQQVEALQASSEAAQQQQHLAGPGGRPPGWGPSRAASRGRLRRGSASGSGSGYLPLARRRTGAVTFTTLRVVVGDSDGSAGGSVALAGEDTSGGGGGPESAGSRSGGGDAGDGRGGDAGSEDGDGERGGEEDEVLYDEELLSYISETDYTEQHRREVLESDAALREELAEVLREKAAAEAERAALERAAVAQRSSFDEARAALEQQLSWLSGNIGAQQQQLQAAQAAEREARELAARWQERAQELEAAIEAREEALRRLRSELEAVEGNAMRSGEERAALRQQYEQRIAAVVAQVSTLQRQLQQHASSAATNDRRERQQQSERAAALEAELTRMRSQQAELKRQLSERVARYERESAARVKELAALRKAAASARSRMAALEQENRAQRLLLRAKQQEVLAAEQRLRDSQRGGGGTGGGGGGGGTRSRSSSPGCRGYLGRTGSSGNVAEDGGRGGGTRSAPASGARAKSPSPGPQQRPWDGGARPSSLQQLEDIAAEELLPLRSAGAGSNSSTSDNSGSVPRSRQGRQQLQQDAAAAEAEAEAPPPPPPGPEEQAELTEWAEQLLGLVAEAAGVEARVEVLAVRHQELRARREMLLREQSQFGLRTRRRAEQLAQAVAACEAELAGLAARAAEAEAAAERGGGGGAEEPGASAGGDGAAEGEEQQQREAEGQLAALHQRMAEVSHARDVLQARARSGRLLDEREQQVVDSLDDQLDDLETQLSYITGELADRRAALAQLQRRREQLQRRAREVGPAGLRMALAAATEAVGHRAYQVRQLEAALAASEAGAARREAQLQFRLRESLVSLSAHIASLEATSPSSSVCLDSSELRNLLGIYLDLDLDRDKDKEARDRDPVDSEKEREPGQPAPGGGAGQAQGHKGAPLPPSPPPPQQQQQPGASHSGGHLPDNTQPAAAAPAGSSGGEEDEEQQRQSEPRLQHQQQQGAAPALLPELPQADSLAVWGSSSRPGADGAGGAAQPQPQHPQPQHPQQHQAQQQHQLRPSALGLRAWDGPDLSQQARPPPLHANAAAATGADWPLNGHSPSRSQLPQSHPQQHPQNGSLPDSRMRSTSSTDNASNGDGNDSSSSARLAGVAQGDHPDGAARGGVATPARAPFSSQPQPQPQSQPQHFRAGPGSGSGSGSLGGGAPPSPTAGILRRAGSLESVGSVGLSSGSTKRVTWSEQIATDPASAGPPPSPTRSAPSGGSGLGGFGFGGAGGGAGHGGGSAAARGKERSILDRAGSLRAGTVARRGSGSGGTGPGAAGAVVASDEGSVPGGRCGDGVPRPGRDNNPVEARAAGGGVLGGGAATADVCRGGDESGGGGTRARSGDGDGLAAGNGRGPAAVVPLSARSSVESDDTVAASDAGAAPDDASGGGAADEAGAAKASVRSFNPWRDSTTAGGGGGGTAHKQLRTARELYAEPQGQQLQPELLRLSFEADEDVVSSTQPSPQPGGRGNGGVGGVGGEGGLRLAPQGDGLEEALHDIEPGGGAAASVDSSGLAGGQRQLQPPRQSQWQEPEESQFFAAYLSKFSGSGAAGPGRGGTFTSRESRPGGLDPERGAGGNGAEATAAAWSVCRTDGYDSDGDELEAHVRLLEQAVSAATAVGPPPPRRRPPAPHQGPGRATPTPRGWGSDADGRRAAAAAAAADSFGYAVVFDRDSDSDSDIYCVSQGPTPREPAAAHGVPARPPRGRFSLDRPADTGSSSGGGGKGHLACPNNSAPLPLPGPVRSASPVQHHYGRLKHHKPWPGPAGAAPAPAPAAPPAPGPFTNPKPVGAMAALSEALMPYKAHLKRSSGGSGGASGGRADTPEAGRRGAGAGSGVKANFVSPQPQRYQSQGGGSSGGWPPGQDDGGAPTHQQPQRQLQQPWRALGAGQGASAGAAMVLDGPPYTARQDREERQAAAAALRAAGQNTRFVP